MKRRAQPWLGTLVEISMNGQGDDAMFTRAFEQAFAKIAHVHRIMSFHDSGSDVSRFNRARTGDLVPIDPHTANVFRLAATVAEASGGIFNIACAPKLVASGHLPCFDAPTPAPRPQRSVYRLESSSQVRKLADAWIDLGGIAKGYAVDLAIEALQACNIDDACVNAGGDLRVIGERAWPVVIRAAADSGQVGSVLELRDEAMATSAPYFSLREQAGEKTSALLDGESGSCVTDAVSASVRSLSCAVSDALTKVVIATRDARHPALALFEASAFII